MMVLLCVCVCVCCDTYLIFSVFYIYIHISIYISLFIMVFLCKVNEESSIMIKQMAVLMRSAHARESVGDKSKT